MQLTTTVMLLLLLAPVWAVVLYPCAQPPLPEMVQYVAEASTGLPKNEAYHLDSLPHQLLNNPCLEVEHYGRDRKLSRAYSIYGTCNYREMFRYSARIVPPHGCWRSELAYRSKPGGQCTRFRLNWTINIQWHQATMTINMDTDRKVTIHLLKMATYYEGFNLRSPDAEEWGEFNDARVQQCRCNRSSRPRQSELWQRQPRCLESSSRQEASTPVGWLAVSFLVIGAIGAFVAVLYCRVM